MEIELSRLMADDTPVAGEVSLSAQREVGERHSLAEEGVSFPAAFAVDARARREDERYVVAGTIRGRVDLVCSRCLGPIRHDVDVEFASRFARELLPSVPGAQAEPGDEDGLQGSAEELDVSYLPPEASALSVESLVREQVLLDIPVRPLCRPGCAGLCQRCGADLNAGDCACASAPDADLRDIRLAPLLELRKRLEGK